MPLQEPKPIISGLDAFYNYSRDVAWLLVRLTAGGFLLIHGMQKIAGSSVAGFAANSLARRGIEPALPLAYALFFLETVGALCLMLGLFTRFFAVAVGIEFMLIVFNAHWGTGFKDFAWSRPGGGWEYPLFWGLIIAAIALRGGGPYSVDRKLGREL